MPFILEEDDMDYNNLTPVLWVAWILVLFACGDASETASSQNTSTAAAASDSVTYQGIDVSHYQGSVDWTSVKVTGITFAFAKATEGDSEVDPEFSANWNGMKDAGIVRGAYHYFDPDDDAQTQAEHFIATVQLEPGDLPPVLDIEVSDGVSVEGIDEDIKVWLETVAQAYGVTPIIYSDQSFLEEYLPSGFSAYPLWIAAYSETAPTAPGDWTAWTFWQYADTGTVNGVNGAVDQDSYQGTEADWKQLLVPEKH